MAGRWEHLGPEVRWWLEIQGACSIRMQPLDGPGQVDYHDYTTHGRWVLSPSNSSRRETLRKWMIRLTSESYYSYQDLSLQTIPNILATWSGVGESEGRVGRSRARKVYYQDLHFTDEETRTAGDQDLGLSSHLSAHIYSLFISVLLLLGNWNECGVSSCGLWALVAPEILEKIFCS